MKLLKRDYQSDPGLDRHSLHEAQHFKAQAHVYRMVTHFVKRKLKFDSGTQKTSLFYLNSSLLAKPAANKSISGLLQQENLLT